jgi:hypothetical protein
MTLPEVSLEELRRLDAELEQLAKLQPVWSPQPGPQTVAFESRAHIVGYGGAAGGGKTDLAIGVALRKHRKVLFLRREATQLSGVLDRFTELLGGREGFNGSERIWRLQDGKQVEFGSTPMPEDWNKYQGRPHDLVVFDEAANFPESTVRALLGWLRSVDPAQHCQALMTFNPPTTTDGRWVVEFFAPWLDPLHPRPAAHGELRWFAMIDGKELEVADGQPFEHNGLPICPQSRTFIGAKLRDNAFLATTGYMATLQALPEPLRSQLLDGDFTAGLEDSPWQVCPTAWVDAAIARWSEPAQRPPMDSLGVDVARGGRDSTVISRRHGMWFDRLLAYPGSQTPDGPTCAGLVVAALRDQSPIWVDVIGVGSSVYDHLRTMGLQVTGVNVAERALGSDKSGRLRFQNQRSETWWALRDALDPASNTGIALPPDQRLRADLTAPTWSLSGSTIVVESKEAIVKRIGRSPDFGSAVCLALIDSPKVGDQRAGSRRAEWDPMQNLERELQRARSYDHDPYSPLAMVRR